MRFKDIQVGDVYKTPVDHVYLVTNVELYDGYWPGTNSTSVIVIDFVDLESAEVINNIAYDQEEFAPWEKLG